VAGRALAFADPEIIRMAKENYIPVTGDDWYQRRREDAEGEFFRTVADQGPRKGQGGSTRQGIYMFTAGAKLLAYKNAGQAPEVMREVLKQGLKEWNKLPAADRKPGAVRVEPLPKQDPRYSRRPPQGGLVLDVFTRILDNDQSGPLCRGNCDVPGGSQAARDHLWLTEGEWHSLIPTQTTVGLQFPLSRPLAERIARFHLVDNTRGEPPLWKREEIRSCEMKLSIEESTATYLHMRLEGSVLLATDADKLKARRGFEGQLLGTVHYDAVHKTIDRLEVIVLGDHWGEGPFTRGARPGQKPLGIVFELTSKDEAANQVPPQAARDLDDYFGKRP
jgi:hypothetical protein